MKRRIVILAALVIALAIFAFGCAKVETDGDDQETSMFVQVESTAKWDIVYQKSTRVMYAVSSGLYNGGTFTLLVNPDGTPMIWEG